MKIFVVSDIHSNLEALRVGLAQMDAQGYDHLIILGDLFTYGPSPNEVFTEVEKILERPNVHLIKGNHDQLYIDLFNNSFEYFNKLPDWLKESVSWTLAELESVLPRILALPWKENLALNPILFSHANPFRYGDWRYLNDQPLVREALLEIQKQGFSVGVFGHNHRKASFRLNYENSEISELTDFKNIKLSNIQPIYLNPGSLGQPRDTSKFVSYLSLNCQGDNIIIEWHNVKYSVTDYCEKIRRLPLSSKAKLKITSYV